MIADMARDFAQYKLAPGDEAREKAGEFEPEIRREAVAFRLAELETAGQLVLNVARMCDAGQKGLREPCMAKLFASEAAERICSGAIQTSGG